MFDAMRGSFFFGPQAYLAIDPRTRSSFRCGWRPPGPPPNPPASSSETTGVSRGRALARKMLPPSGMTASLHSDPALVAALPRERGISEGFDTLADSELIAV